MARQLRIEIPGAFYHVMSRGNQKQAIYLNRSDREKFLNYLESASLRYRAVIHCYCLMENHYHLLLETPEGNLAQIMRHINGAYTSYFNARHSRVGHLFQGRYRAALLDSDCYALVLSRYIHRNPVKGGLCIDPGDYQWSSCCTYFEGTTAATWLRTDFLLLLAGGDNARRRYRQYVEDAESDDAELPRDKGIAAVILGGSAFQEKLCDDYPRTLQVNRDLPAARALAVRPAIRSVVHLVAEKLQEDHRLTKKMSIYLCHRFGGYTLKEIGGYFGVGESAITENSNRFAAALYRDQLLAETVAGVLAELKI